MATRMLQRRGTAAEWAAQNPVLGNGEIGFETDTKIIRVGDGVTPWNSLTLPYMMSGGATMTGPLTLIAPTSANHAARKTDVDAVGTLASSVQDDVAPLLNYGVGSTTTAANGITQETLLEAAEFNYNVPASGRVLTILNMRVQMATGTDAANLRVYFQWVGANNGALGATMTHWERGQTAKHGAGTQFSLTNILNGLNPGNTLFTPVVEPSSGTWNINTQRLAIIGLPA